MDALAVFHDHGVHILAPWLKPGFKHVFVALRDGDYWVRLDAQAGVPTVEVVAPGDYDLAKFYRDQGFTVVETEQGKVVPRSPFAIANCVGLSKAVLSVRSGALTPWHLYKHLKRKST